MVFRRVLNFLPKYSSFRAHMFYIYYTNLTRKKHTEDKPQHARDYIILIYLHGMTNSSVFHHHQSGRRNYHIGNYSRKERYEAVLHLVHMESVMLNWQDMLHLLVLLNPCPNMTITTHYRHS